MNLLGLFWIRPYWLLLLPLIVLTVWMLSRRLGVSGDWVKVCDRHLLRWLVGDGAQGRRRRWVWWLLAFGLCLAAAALAGPSWQQTPSNSLSARLGRVIAVDLSRSMMAQDVKPNRLAQARFKLRDMLEAIDEGQVGLVAYGGRPFVVSPMTTDTQTIAGMVPALTPDIIPAGGSRADRAMLKAAELLEQAGFAQGDILLITDTASREDVSVAADLARRDYRVSVLAVGSEQGAPIPAANGFVKDAAGNIVVASVDTGALRRVARAGDGDFELLKAGETDLNSLLSAAGDRFTDRDDALAARWQDQGYLLLLLLLPLAALAFRRGWLLLLPMVLLPVAPSQAAEWEDLWLRSDQRAQKALRLEQHRQAAELAESPAIRGEALYRGEDYQQALQTWSAVDSADGFYNRGNALAHLGEYEQAIAAYDEALKRQPDMEDALTNKALIEQLLQQQQAEQQADQEQQDQQDQQQSGQEDSQSDTQQSSDQQEPQESEQQDSEQQQENESEEQQSEARQQMQAMAENWSEEDEQAMEQWLRRIPDDPGGLLRRKFLLQHQRSGNDDREAQQW